MRDIASDVADFKQHPRLDFALDAQVEVVGRRRTEARIEYRCRARRDVPVDAGEEGLREGGGRSRDRRIQTIGSNAERSGRGHAAGAEALDGHGSGDTGNRLAETDAQQRDQHQADAVQTAIDLAVTAADDGLAVAQQLPEYAVGVLRIPGQRRARADAAVERIERILVAGARYIGDGGEAEGRVIHRALQRVLRLGGEVVA